MEQSNPVCRAIHSVLQEVSGLKGLSLAQNLSKLFSDTGAWCPQESVNLCATSCPVLC